MRPSHDKLLAKLKRLDILKDNPEGMFWLLGQLSHWSFVHQARHPDWIARLIAQLHGQWELAAGGGRKFEIPENAVTTEDEPKSRSLQMVQYGGIDGKIVGFKERQKQYVEEGSPSETDVKRNNTTPGPSHKSPVLYRNAVGAGFTVPGVDGKFVWHGTEPKQEPPNMLEVVQKLAQGLHLGSDSGSGEALDLNDKKLKKRVRQIIFDHTVVQLGPNNRVQCEGEDERVFDFLEEWAVHVRKLIWKELKRA